MKFILYCFLVIPALAAICVCRAAEADTATNMVEEIRQLRSRIEALEKRLSETNQPAPSAREAPEPAAATLEAIRKSARDEIDINAAETDGEKEFTFGALGLQALNPEISITGDMLASWVPDDSGLHRGSVHEKLESRAVRRLGRGIGGQPAGHIRVVSF